MSTATVQTSQARGFRHPVPDTLNARPAGLWLRAGACTLRTQSLTAPRTNKPRVCLSSLHTVLVSSPRTGPERAQSCSHPLIPRHSRPPPAPQTAGSSLNNRQHLPQGLCTCWAVDLDFLTPEGHVVPSQSVFWFSKGRPATPVAAADAGGGTWGWKLGGEGTSCLSLTSLGFSFPSAEKTRTFLSAGCVTGTLTAVSQGLLVPTWLLLKS